MLWKSLAEVLPIAGCKQLTLGIQAHLWEGLSRHIPDISLARSTS